MQVKAGQNQAQWEVSVQQLTQQCADECFPAISGQLGSYTTSVATPQMCMHGIHVAVCLQEKGWIKPEYDPRGWFHW